MLIDETVLARLDAYVPLAPLHPAHNLSAIRTIGQRFPGVPGGLLRHGVPPHGARVASSTRSRCPARPRGVRRYVFTVCPTRHVARRRCRHGSAGRGRPHRGDTPRQRFEHARCPDHSILNEWDSLAVDGLPMGTQQRRDRSGVLTGRLMDGRSCTARPRRLLYPPFRAARVSAFPPTCACCRPATRRARLALDLYVYRAGHWPARWRPRSATGSTRSCSPPASGEHRAGIRAICQAAAWLGLRLDDDANRRHGPRISRDDSTVSAWVIGPTSPSR